MKKVLLSVLICVGLVASAHATTKEFKLVNKTGYTQTISQLYLTKQNGQALTNPSPVPDFVLSNGVTKTITLLSTTTDPFLCQLHAFSLELGDFDVANNVTFYPPDTYALKYDSLLNIMTITKQ